LVEKLLQISWRLLSLELNINAISVCKSTVGTTVSRARYPQFPVKSRRFKTSIKAQDQRILENG